MGKSEPLTEAEKTSQIVESSRPHSIGATGQAPVIDVDHLFTYHPPTGDQPQRYESIRNAAKVFAHVILLNTKPSADQTTAIRKLRECVQVANASIALEK